MKFSHTIPPRGRVYQTEAGDEAIISRNNQTGSIIGTLKTHDGRSFALEKCNDSYIFQQFNVASFPTDEVIDEGDFDPTLIVAPDTRSGSGYNYSIMFYYTAEFAAVTSNIGDFIDQVIAETNQGYANSRIPITATKLCQELATVPDQTDARALLREFKQMKGTVSELRNTADAAALLSVDISHCGMAYMATATSGNTLSVTKKSCALGYYSFGHEVAHNLGASHNKEVTTNNNFDDGHAHLIESGAAVTGYRTILGYYADGHDIRVITQYPGHLHREILIFSQKSLRTICTYHLVPFKLPKNVQRCPFQGLLVFEHFFQKISNFAKYVLTPTF